MTEDSFIIKYKPYFIKDFKLEITLENAFHTFLEIDDLNVLIYGASSTGKTMLLEAFIREYYHLQKQDPFPEHNILYINNLKEQGISYYRNEMKTFCQSQSVIYGKKKMIIIDDIDNVNEQSQQVFRNYIDKYHDNIHFIGACTNMQKVIESVQSRLHIIQMHVLKEEDLIWHMERILEKEKIEMDETCKEYLLSISNRCVRSLINYLEKIYILQKKIDLDLCKKVCSHISVQHFEHYLQAYFQKDLKKGIQILYDLYDIGYSVMDILDFFFFFIKQTDLLDEMTKYHMIPIICKYVTIFHNVHEDVIELAFFTNHLCRVKGTYGSPMTPPF
jgi:DNA polymerase III delta prime subunit